MRKKIEVFLMFSWCFQFFSSFMFQMSECPNIIWDYIGLICVIYGTLSGLCTTLNFHEVSWSFHSECLNVQMSEYYIGLICVIYGTLGGLCTTLNFREVSWSFHSKCPNVKMSECPNVQMSEYYIGLICVIYGTLSGMCEV